MTHNASMATDSASFPLDTLLAHGSGPSRCVVQVYRCPAGHLNKITWSAAEMALAAEHNDIKFYCERCGTARLASALESASLIAALGLVPAKRRYSS